MFGLAHACLCLRCVVGRRRREVEEGKSGVQKEEVSVCAQGETEATFLRLPTETSIISTCRYVDMKQTPIQAPSRSTWHRSKTQIAQNDRPVRDLICWNGFQQLYFFSLREVDLLFPDCRILATVEAELLSGNLALKTNVSFSWMLFQTREE